MRSYKCLESQIFKKNNYSIVPIREQDKLKIMQWRNEQMYHLRQNKILTEIDQTYYFENTITKLFEQEHPNQILFSYLKDENCIGYGGLVHINWVDKNAEISFVMKTDLEEKYFNFHWSTYLQLIEVVAFQEIQLHKLFTYAFDLRPHLYTTIESIGYKKDAILKEHCLIEGEYKDVIIHSKTVSQRIYLKQVTKEDVYLLFTWVNEPIVRKNAFHSDPIIWENHVNWFQRKLDSVTSKMFILYKHEKPVGQIRLDLIDNEWEIDYSIDKRYRSQGLGKKIIYLMILNSPSSIRLKATVKNENIASLKVFQQLGFKKTLTNNKMVSFLLKN